MTIGKNSIILSIVSFGLVLVASLWLFASDDSPEQIIKKQIKQIDTQKVEQITTIKQKQDIDMTALSGVIKDIQTLEGDLERTIKHASGIKGRMERRDRCVSILSGSLGSISMIDCEEVMQKNTGNALQTNTGSILQATFK